MKCSLRSELIDWGGECGAPREIPKICSKGELGVWVYVLGVYVELLLFVEVLDQYHDDAFAGVYVRLFVYLSHNFCCFIVSNKRCIVLSVPVRPRQCAHCVAHYAELDPPQGRPRPDGRSARVSLRVMGASRSHILLFFYL